ncbi:BSD domain (BTF2 transcription factor, Synapse-associated protein and DOS2-like protein) [Trifolium repens]|nr:BSD domain (BTF2 transcription factor, Synapse-associated protein and DOS2-like protein) [Trifolium repens]
MESPSHFIYLQSHMFFQKDHGIFRDGSKEIAEAQHPLYRRTLLQDLNRQGAVVLEGKTLEYDGVKEEERRNRISKMIQIEDLQAQDGHPDPRDYFDSQQANAVKTSDDSLAGTEQTRCSLGYEEAYGSLRASISKIETKGLNDPLLSPEVALKVLNGLTKNISSTKSHLGKNSHENVFDLLPSTTREKLLDHWLCSQELLRHFWSSYPITAQNLINKSTSPLFPFLSKEQCSYGMIMCKQLNSNGNCAKNRGARHHIVTNLVVMELVMSNEAGHGDANF